MLLAVGIYAFIEGVRRLFDPAEVTAGGLLVFGIVGLVGNIVAVAVLSTGRSANLNMRAAFLEVVNDALGSVAVIISAIVISLTGWTRIDAIAGMVIAAVIVPRAITILKKACGILLESTPKGLNLDDVRRHILEVPHVIGVHDLHASTIATGLPVLTAHVVVDEACFTQGHVSQASRPPNLIASPNTSTSASSTPLSRSSLPPRLRGAQPPLVRHRSHAAV